VNLCWLASDSAPDAFPDVELALDEPEGLLAAGGDLKTERLIEAYRRGIFPWYENGQPILWWCPDPRTVLVPENLHVSRSLRRTIRRSFFRISIDKDFAGVIAGCAAERAGQNGTWITPAMREAYLAMHDRGMAHSIEVWHDERLVGGIYGVSLGRVYFGESMFSRMNDASKVALVELVSLLQNWNFALIDCQISSAHLQTMGSSLMPRKRFVELIARLCSEQPNPAAWSAKNST